MANFHLCDYLNLAMTEMSQWIFLSDEQILVADALSIASAADSSSVAFGLFW